MATKLIVREPFGVRAVGDEITDEAEMAEVMEHHAAHVVRVAVPEDEPSKGRSKPIDQN